MNAQHANAHAKQPAYSIAYSRRASIVPTPVCQLHIKSVRTRYSERGLIQLTRCIMLSLLYVSCMQSLLAQSVLLSHNPRMCLRVSWMTFFDLQRSEHRVIHRVESFQKVSIFLLCYPVTQAGKQVSFFFELTMFFFSLSNSHFFYLSNRHVIHTRGP